MKQPKGDASFGPSFVFMQEHLQGVSRHPPSDQEAPPLAPDVREDGGMEFQAQGYRYAVLLEPARPGPCSTSIAESHRRGAGDFLKVLLTKPR